MAYCSLRIIQFEIEASVYVKQKFFLSAEMPRDSATALMAIFNNSDKVKSSVAPNFHFKTGYCHLMLFLLGFAYPEPTKISADLTNTDPIPRA